MSEQPQVKRIAYDPRAHRWLEILADLDLRTLSGELEFLLKQEIQRRGYDPDTCEPSAVPAASRSASD